MPHRLCRAGHQTLSYIDERTDKGIVNRRNLRWGESTDTPSVRFPQVFKMEATVRLRHRLPAVQATCRQSISRISGLYRAPRAIR